MLIKSTQGKVVLKLTKEAGTKPEKNDLKGTVVILPQGAALLLIRNDHSLFAQDLSEDLSLFGQFGCYKFF